MLIPQGPPPPVPTERQVMQRQKQHYFGFVTVGYWNYRAHYCLTADALPLVPPDINQALYKKKWDKLCKEWRRYLHLWDNRPCRMGYDQTVEWKTCVLPEIEEARKAVLALNKGVSCSTDNELLCASGAAGLTSGSVSEPTEYTDELSSGSLENTTDRSSREREDDVSDDFSETSPEAHELFFDFKKLIEPPNSSRSLSAADESEASDSELFFDLNKLIKPPASPRSTTDPNTFFSSEEKAFNPSFVIESLRLR